MLLAICDDDHSFLERFRPQVETLGLARRVDCFSAPDQLFRALEGGAGYDAVLLDIDWKQDTTGMDIAAQLLQHAPETRIIYVTGYNDRFSQRIFLQCANLSGYLVKPVDTALLRANLEKVARSIRAQGEPTLTVSVGGRPVSIPCRELLYLESLGHTVHLHTPGERITVYERLDQLVPRLPDGFLRCHKSFLVNMRHIRRFQVQDVLLDTGDTVPVSRSRCTEAKATYFRYIGRTFCEEGPTCPN